MGRLYFYQIFLTFVIFLTVKSVNCCQKSITTNSGPSSKPGILCSGDKIFEDNFQTLNLNKWQHEITLAGGGNWEFQWYDNDRENSYVKNGKLYIKPTLTSAKFGEPFLTSGTADLNQGPNKCTNAEFYGCKRQGSPTNIINPIRSARLRTKDSFSFKYGRVQVRAKISAGDWIWPAIWLLPTNNVYGGWPISGEIDMMEARGNLNMKSNGHDIGPEQIGSTLHFGPKAGLNGWETAHYVKNLPNNRGYDKNFHTYEMEWTPNHITFKVDNTQIGKVDAKDGFFKRGYFPANINNPWKTKMAPFDQEFHMILNVAVGGVNGFFPDDNVQYRAGKPWSNQSPKAATDFWNGRASWLPTWNMSNRRNTDRALIVDYVRVFAL